MANFQLNVVGEGILMDELIQKSYEEKVINDVNKIDETTQIIKFHGAVSEPIEYYKSNHIFILPSLS